MTVEYIQAIKNNHLPPLWGEHAHAEPLLEPRCRFVRLLPRCQATNPSEVEQIVVLSCLDVYQSPDSGENQYKSRNVQNAIWSCFEG